MNPLVALRYIVLFCVVLCCNIPATPVSLLKHEKSAIVVLGHPFSGKTTFVKECGMIKASSSISRVLDRKVRACTQTVVI